MLMVADRFEVIGNSRFQGYISISQTEKEEVDLQKK